MCVVVLFFLETCSRTNYESSSIWSSSMLLTHFSQTPLYSSHYFTTNTFTLPRSSALLR